MPDYVRGQVSFLDVILAKRRFALANKLIAAWPPQLRQGRLLDIGCGSYPSFLLTVDFAEKHGLDPNVSGDYPGITFWRQPFSGQNSLPFSDGFFNAVVLLAVIEHFSRQQGRELLAEIYRILAPGGRLVLTTPAPWSDGLLRFLAASGLASKEEINEHQMIYGKKDLLADLTAAGFKMGNIRCGYFELFLNQWCLAAKNYD